jgi:hypothetical protein
VRRNSGITVLNRVVYAGRVFEVLHVDDVGFRHFEMRLSCKEVV